MTDIMINIDDEKEEEECISEISGLYLIEV